MKWESTVISRWGRRKRFSNDEFTDGEERHSKTNTVKSGAEERSESRCSCLLTCPSSCNRHSAGRRNSSCCSSLGIQSWWLWHCFLPLDQTHLQQKCDTQPWQGKIFADTLSDEGRHLQKHKTLLWGAISWSILAEARRAIWSLKPFTWLSGL